MPAGAPKSYHHGDLREALLNAAEEALSELPLEAVSLREIARRAGVSHAAPKHHFASVGELYGELAGRGFERFVAALDEAASRSFDQSPAKRLQAMARAYVRFAEANRATYGLMFGRRAGVEAVRGQQRSARGQVLVPVLVQVQVHVHAGHVAACADPVLQGRVVAFGVRTGHPAQRLRQAQEGMHRWQRRKHHVHHAVCIAQAVGNGFS